MWLQFTAKSTGPMAKLRAKLKQSVGKVAIVSKLVVCAEVANDHMQWAEDIAKEFGAAVKLADPPTGGRKAPCGLWILGGAARYELHGRMCNSCRRVQGLTPQALGVANKKQPKVTILKPAVLIPAPANLNGLLPVLQSGYKEAMEIADMYDRAVNALKGMEEVGARLKALQEEMERDRKALATFLEGDKR